MTVIKHSMTLIQSFRAKPIFTALDGMHFFIYFSLPLVYHVLVHL
jgi:hypothetical protein